MKNIIVCNTSDDSLSKINIEEMSVDTLPLKFGGEKIGPRSIDIKGERGVIANCYADSITFINTEKFVEEENFIVGKYPKDIKWVDDKVYVACGDSNSLVIFNSKKKEIEFEIKVGDYPSSIAIDEKRDYIYVANMNSNSISIINNKRKKVEREIYLNDTPTKILISKNKENIFVCENSFIENMRGSLMVYSLNDFKLVDKYSLGVFPMDIIEHENLAYTSNLGDGSISVVNLLNKNSYRIMALGMPKVLLKDQGNLIISDYYKGNIVLLDEKTMNKKIIAVGNEPNAMIFTNFDH